MTDHKIGTREEWQAARAELLSGLPHLGALDATMICVSAAPIDKLLA